LKSMSEVVREVVELADVPPRDGCGVSGIFFVFAPSRYAADPGELDLDGATETE